MNMVEKINFHDKLKENHIHRKENTRLADDLRWKQTIYRCNKYILSVCVGFFFTNYNTEYILNGVINISSIHIFRVKKYQNIFFK